MTAPGDRSEVNPNEEPDSTGPEAAEVAEDSLGAAAEGSTTEPPTSAEGDTETDEPELVADEADDSTDEVAELTEDLKRVTAEYSNYRRRVARDRDVAVAEAKAKVLAGLLEIADELGMAAQHGDLDDEGPLRKFNDKFFAVLTAQGVAEFGEAGDDFDPNLHEAVQDTSDGADPKVETVLRKGYRVDDRVLRTAMVIVGA